MSDEKQRNSKALSLTEHVQMSSSAKAIGEFEKPLIEAVAKHFRSLGYHVLSHVRLNISWAPILSDVDLILLKDGAVTIVEVKSKHDKLSRASIQLLAIRDYVDFAYLATERLPKFWSNNGIGLLLVQGARVDCVGEAERLTDKPSLNSFFALQKKCLLRLLGIESRQSCVSKFEAAQQASGLENPAYLRDLLKQIATCSRLCETDCPISNSSEKPLPLAALCESYVTLRA